MSRKSSILIAICFLINVQLLCAAAECEIENNQSLYENKDGKIETGSCSTTEKKTQQIEFNRVERTFCMVKPDGVQRNLVGEIIKRFEVKGLKLLAIKLVWPKVDVVTSHYQSSADKEFFDSLIGYMKRGPVVAMVWEGYNCINIGRQLLTGGNRFDPVPGSIRGDFSSNDLIHRFTVAHGSDTVEEAEREIKLWFNEDELVDWSLTNEMWIYQKTA